MRCKIVRSLEEYHKELAIKIRGEMKEPETGLVMTAETFYKVFSPERIKLLQRLQRNNANIYQIAKELDKPYEVVFRNIKYLEGIGLVKVREKDKTKIPYINGKLSVEILA